MGLIFDIRVFFMNPANVYLSIAAVSMSLLFFLFLKFNPNSSNKQKLALTYGHIFALVFPAIYFMYSTGCRMLFDKCDNFGAFLYIGTLTILSGLITAVLIAPFFLLSNYKKKSRRLADGYGKFITDFVSVHATKCGIKVPEVYLFKSAKPVAFSFSHFRNMIFISEGMADLLTKKELEAVLLHEISHIRQGASSLKISEFSLKVFSPLSGFASFGKEIDREEELADEFASFVQGTSCHVQSAKRKLIEFFRSVV